MKIRDNSRDINVKDVLYALDNTEISIFVYYPHERKVVLPENLCRKYNCNPVYEDMPYSFAEQQVFSEDREEFIEMYNRIHSGEKVASARFRSIDQTICLKDTLTTVARDEEGQPQIVFGVVFDAADSYRNDRLIEQLHHRLEAEDESREMAEVMKVIAASIGGQYYAIYHIWMEDHTYVCFSEKKEGILSQIGERGKYEPAWDVYREKYIVSEDREEMREFADLSTLQQKLANNHSISHTYRRIGIGWTRGTFIAGKRDEDGKVTNVIYSVADINAEIAQEKMQRQAFYDAAHDSLTGIYNRKGFSEVISSEDLKNGKLGFIILDIDNFKSLNDNFGHAIGDKVLVTVAEQLTSVFYQEDIIARIGGDEFAILLRDCDASAWNKICLKLRTIHATLANCLPKTLDLSVTLSSGISFSETGYSKDMYRLADEGLYETKRLGRAGCTLVSPEHQILEHWQDETLSLLAKNVLEYNNAGVCQIEIPDDPQRPRRLICGETEKVIMGIPQSATPEESYVLWRDRIDPTYMDTLLRAERSMIESGQTECTFLWNHPDFGAIFLRCGGFGEKRKNSTVLTGYCHTLKETHIIEQQTDQTEMFRALNDTFVASYYMDLGNNTATAFKLGSGAKYIFQNARTILDVKHDFLSSVVDSRDYEVMETFLDLEAMPERLREERFLDAEYRSRLLSSWCRARLLPVRFDRDGYATHVLLTITALESGKFKEVYTLDYNRRSLASLFNNLPCGIVMYEWKDDSLELVHVSRYYEEHYGHRLIKAGENNKYMRNDDCVHPDDREAYIKALDRAMTETCELHHEYRVWDEKSSSYTWERVDAVISAQANDAKLIYALYTDITQIKEQEILLEKSHTSLLAALDASDQLCYEYDPEAQTGECLTDDNFFGLPKYIKNYPDSLRDIELFHPEDVEKFIETAHLMDDGRDSAQCDVRIRKNGEYCWYACTFSGYYDPDKAGNVAILTIVDISLRMATQKMYEDRLKSMSAITENTLCMSIFNLTEGTYELVECDESVRPYVRTDLPLRDYLVFAATAIIGEESQKKFREMFNIENLLQQVAEGNTHLQIEYLLKVSEEHYEWIFSVIDMIQNPLTGEVTGAIYSRSQQTEKMNKMLLERTLEQDYLFVATIFVDTDEFYLYNYHKARYSQCMQKYWDIALTNMQGHCTEEVQEQLKEIFVKEKILNHLENHSEFTFAYEGVIFDAAQRLEIRFNYADSSHTMLMASMRNITDTALLAKYRHDSEHDSLTDLYNRKTLFRKCRELLDAHEECSFALLHVDIKHFRLYNTFFGDAAGDKLLCDIADIFRRIDEVYDCWEYGRIEADVFAAFFPYNKEMYHEQIVKIMEYLKNYRPDFMVEPVVGLYHVTDRNMPIEAMFTRATVAAKMVQPDTPFATMTFDETMEKNLKDDQEILSEMQNAIDREQFQVCLQPKYSLRTNRPIGAEALARWIHPEWGLVSPARFIPLFESNGFVVTLDRYMWEHACQLLSKWKKNGQPMLPISVNVSRISAYGQDTVNFLKELVTKYDIEPKYLELELTESAYVEGPEELRSRLAELQEYGFRILMDDFGSGYSSLNTLKELPIDVLKLDMKFLSSDDNGRGSKILSSMIRMSKLLNLPVIAEGVETSTQANYMRSIGCEYVQGYLYARPMPVDEYEKTVLHMLLDETEQEPEELRYSPILDILLRDESAAKVIDDTIPNPIALMECHNEQIGCLRANKGFIDVFGMREDSRSLSELIETHLSEQDYNRMLRAFRHCAETKKSVSFRLSWQNDDGTGHKYLVNAVYEGHIGVEQVFVVAFIDEEPEDYFE